MPECKWCHKQIIFCIAENNRRMPLDVKPVTMFEINGMSCKTVKVYQSHFVTCRKYRKEPKIET